MIFNRSNTFPLTRTGSWAYCLSDREWARLFAPVDTASLVVFRVCFGAIMVWEVFRYAAYGWIKTYYIDPAYYFGYFALEWLKPWPGDGMYWHFLALGALAACITVGLWYRAASCLFFLGFTYVFLLDEAHYLNHFYLISLISLLMVFLPANRALSVDAWRNPAIRSQTAPAWTLWLLRAQIGLVYFFGGVAKLNGDWLAGEPMRMWLAERTSFPLIGMYFTDEWMVMLFSYGGLLLDLLFFPLAVWWRTRWLALALAAGFHVTNAMLFSIGIFPWFMLAANLLFLNPSWTRWLAGRIRGVADDTQIAPTDQTQYEGNLTTSQRGVIALLAAYLAFQIFIPLRHFLYPGDVNWTEQGHRFSWHMKLRDKDGGGRFFVTAPARRETWEIDPLDYLTGEQYEEMMTRPDMILQFAHHVAADYRAGGHGEIEVRAWVKAALNGREPQWLIDSSVNLAAQPRTLLAADWILPLETPLVLTRDEE